MIKWTFIFIFTCYPWASEIDVKQRPLMCNVFLLKKYFDSQCC